jgi:hypothetical protein
VRMQSGHGSPWCSYQTNFCYPIRSSIGAARESTGQRRPDQQKPVWDLLRRGDSSACINPEGWLSLLAHPMPFCVRVVRNCEQDFLLLSSLQGIVSQEFHLA